MKKLKGPLFLLLVFIGGYFYIEYDYNKATIEQAELVVEEHIRERYQQIETVEIEKVYRGSSGSMNVDGTVNNQAEFYLSLDEDTFKVQSTGLGEGFPDEKEDYDLETRQKYAAIAESYLRNNYESIETFEIRRVSRRYIKNRGKPDDIKVGGSVNTYAFIVILDADDLSVIESAIYSSREGLSTPYEKPERKPDCYDEDCDY